MLNDATVYWQAGYKAGRAQRKGDTGMVRQQKDWLMRAITAEVGKDRQTARDEYSNGYAEAART